MPFWRAPVTEADIAANLRFHPIAQKTPALRRRSHWHLLGIATFACWLGAFGFYLYTRIGRTMDSHSNIFAYQVRFCCHAILHAAIPHLMLIASSACDSCLGSSGLGPNIHSVCCKWNRNLINLCQRTALCFSLCLLLRVETVCYGRR